MAKRSDFAQKLLDDLRLRKERMTTSQRSSQSNQMPIDAYAYAKQTYRGSRNTKASEIVNSRTGDRLNRSSRSHRSANIGEVSNQIVSYGRGQSSVQMGEMSLALAFAFENGGKLKRTDSSFSSSIMGFLNQITRGAMNFGKMERRGNLDRQLASTSHFPTFSPVQINEIYKGAQKLNQILRASSNGLNIDRRSIEFAKELLQGAINLEESLKMLVDMQESSEFMVTRNKKNRIILLEDDNDDDDDDQTIKTSEQKQLARPIFSFDKPSGHSRNLQEYENISITQRPITFTYSKESRKVNNEKKDVNKSKLLSHKRSTSYNSDIKNLNVLSEQKNQSVSVESNPEKSRIPNVIAKLMGLDNLPEKVEVKYTPQKDSSSTQKIEGMTFKHTATGSAKKIELKNKQTENLVPLKKQKVMEPINMPATQDKELMLGVDKNLNMQKARSEVVVHSEIKTLKGSDKATIKVDKLHDSAVKMNFIREGRADVQVKGRKQDITNNREQKGTGKSRTDDPPLNNMLTQIEQAHERSEVKSSLQKFMKPMEVFFNQKRDSNKKTLSNQKKSQNHLGIQKSGKVMKYGPQEEKHHREQRSKKQMLQARPQRSETTSKNLSKPLHEPINSQKKLLLINQVASIKHNSAETVDAMISEGFPISYYGDLIRYEVSNDINVQGKEMMNRKSGQISSPRNRESEQVKGRQGILTVMDDKSVYKLPDKKVKNIRRQKIDMPGKIDEVLIRSSGTMLHMKKQAKQQSPILQQVRQRISDKFNVSKETEQERVGVFKEADARIISFNEPVAIIEPLEVRHQPHKEAELPPTLYSPDGGELQSPQEPVALVPNYLYQGVKSVVISDSQGQATLVAADEEFKSCGAAPNTINGSHEDRMDISSLLQLRYQNISEKRSQKPLTESENCLKWNLVKSQLFLNTAEALFRFDIPFSILQGGGWDNQDLGSKLILDCGYEVMKRKGIRQEFKVHPCSKISISPIRIRSLDGLVRQLNEDIEKLKFYERNRSSRVEVEDYLPKMLENDVYNKDPDIECMWELGWNEETFAFIQNYDAIREMEKHVLNGLLDEITGELWHFQGGLNMTTKNSVE